MERRRVEPFALGHARWSWQPVAMSKIDPWIQRVLTLNKLHRMVRLRLIFYEFYGLSLREDDHMGDYLYIRQNQSFLMSGTTFH